MARFNEILNGRFNRALQKITSIKGEAPAPVLGSEILPVFPMFFGKENRYLESWQTFGSFAAISAVAAQSAIFHFRNPAGSNLLSVVEKLTFTSTTTTVITAWMIVEGPNPSTSADDFGSTPNFCRFDSRGQQNPTCKLTFGNAAADTWPGNNRAWWSSFMAQETTVDVILTDGQEFPVLPGDGFRAVNFTANSPVGVSVVWRERFLEESERT
jgi:hypothetical protein